MRKTIVSLAVLLTVGLVFMGCPKGDDNGDDNGGGGSGVTKFDVTFDADGGTPTPEKQSVEKDKFATKPGTDPSKTDFTFKHWAETATPDTAFNFTGTKIIKNTALRAQYDDDTGSSK